jgi:hypothetical protein
MGYVNAQQLHDAGRLRLEQLPGQLDVVDHDDSIRAELQVGLAAIERAEQSAADLTADVAGGTT